MGHRPRGNYRSCGGQVSRTPDKKVTHSQPNYREPAPGHGPANLNRVQRWEQSHGRGNSRSCFEADRKIDARSKTGTAPDEQTDMREPANKSLLTDVSRLCSYRCTIIASTTSDGIRGEAGLWRLQGLTWDIRVSRLTRKLVWRI